MRPLSWKPYSAAFDDSLPLRLQRFDGVRESLREAARAALAAVMQDCKDMMQDMVSAAVAAQSPGSQVLLHTGLMCEVSMKTWSILLMHTGLPR